MMYEVSSLKFVSRAMFEITKIVTINTVNTVGLDQL